MISSSESGMPDGLKRLNPSIPRQYLSFFWRGTVLGV
jgi:hypothetical protein